MSFGCSKLETPLYRRHDDSSTSSATHLRLPSRRFIIVVTE